MFVIKDFFKINDELKKHLYILGVVIISIAFYRYTENMRLDNILPVVFGVLSPFIYGAIIAYILNAPTRFLEKYIRKIPLFNNHPQKAKSLSITLAMLIMIGVVIGIVAYIIPELTSSMQNIASFLLKFDSDTIEEVVRTCAKQLNLSFSDETYYTIVMSINSLIDTVMDSLKNMPGMFGSVMAQAMNIASSIYTVLMSLIISIYMLFDKEKIGVELGKIMYCFFSRRKSLKIMSLAVHCNEVFESFYVGKLIDSLIIFVIFFVGALILNLPYALFFSLIIGITNIIPYFGPFIGGIPVVLLTFLYDPIKGLWVLLFIIVIQQFDGIILGPKILGDSIGVKPLGVIFAIVVGGAIAGPLGMFFGVPVFSVLSELIGEAVEKNYNSKAITNNYTNSDKSRYHSRRTRNNRNNRNKKNKAPTKIMLKIDPPAIMMPRIIESRKKINNKDGNMLKPKNTQKPRSSTTGGKTNKSDKAKGEQTDANTKTSK